MESNEKPIIDITMSIKVQYLLSITSIYNGVLGAHNWDIISCFIWKESNLVDILPQSNRSVLICLPNRLFNYALNSMNLSKASDFLFTYPNLENLSVK